MTADKMRWAADGAPWPLVLTIVLLAANLRAAVNVIGPLLPAIRDDLNLSGIGAGALTALPTLCFAAFGLTGPAVARRLGPARTIVVSLAVMAGGQLIRALAHGVLAVFAGTTLALAAIAVANVVMPSIVARYFPGKGATMTATYAVTLAAFGAAASAATLPLQGWFGGDWHLGIGMWAALAVVALVPWVSLAVREHAGPNGRVTAHLPFRRVARSLKAWILAGFFGLQALQAYIVFSWYPTILADSGMDLPKASGYVGLISLASMTGSMVVPQLMIRLRNQTALVIALSSCFIAGYIGTALAPLTAPLAWTILIGFGTSFFPMGLYVVSLRARTPAGLLALSGFMQSVGYLIAGIGLLTFGALQADSTNWRPALLGMVVVALVQLVGALVSVSRWSVEEEVAK